ncbi:MAG TPA: cytochrome c [Polyangiaceae bacterium]|nr:cytochrome c [Polyangiaceae bacterium]
MRLSYIYAGVSLGVLMVGACSPTIIDPIGGGPAGAAGRNGGAGGSGGHPVLVSGGAGSGGLPGEGPCLANQHLVYKAPGCGAEAVPMCSGVGGACATAVCGCDGQIRADGCYGSTAPFAYFATGNRQLGGSCDPEGEISQTAQGGTGGVPVSNIAGTGGCPANQHVVYKAPGCGEAAVPMCSAAGPACATPVCGCDGQIRSDDCYRSSAPFAYFIMSAGGFSGTCDADSGVFPQAGQGGTGGGSLGSAGSPLGDSGGGHGGTGAAGGCAANEHLVYKTPGCGVDAAPVCWDGVGGACASTVCGCDGQTHPAGCGTSDIPFAYPSACVSGTAGAGGAVGNPAPGGTVYQQQCAACHGPYAAGNQGSNITLSQTAGIGAWTYQQFYDAVRFAKDKDGSDLCVFMPAFLPKDVSEQGMLDLYAFLQVLPPVEIPNKGTYCP